MTTIFKADVKIIITKLSANLPSELVEKLFIAFIEIKHQLALGKYQPSELNGGHFAEILVRIFEHIKKGSYTPFVAKLDVNTFLNQFSNDMTVPNSLRLIAIKLIPVMMDVRNSRGVGHPSKDIDPNYSDSLLIMYIANWLMIELIRYYHICSLSEARTMVDSINRASFPVIFDYNGHIKILNTSLDYKKKTLLALYYKRPELVSDNQLMIWLKYSNISAYRKNILTPLDKDALIHRDGSGSLLTISGIKFVEKNIDLEMQV